MREVEVSLGVTYVNSLWQFFSPDVGIVHKEGIRVVIFAVATAEDTVHTSLNVAHIGGGFHQLAVEAGSVCYAGEVLLSLDESAKVITAVYIVTNPWEAVGRNRKLFCRCSSNVCGVPRAIAAYIHLCMTQDVGIAGTTEGIIDSSVTQVYIRITADIAFVTATVQVLSLRYVRIRSFRRVDGLDTLQVDGAAVVGIIDIFSAAILLTYYTFLSATEDLEDIALVQVHRGAAPYLGILTKACTEECHGQGHHVFTLLFVVNVRLICAGLEYLTSVQDILIDVDDHVTVHMSTVVAASIDVAVQQAQVLVEGAFGGGFHEVILFIVPFGSVPLQLCSYLGQLIVSIRNITGNFRSVGSKDAGTQVGSVVFLSLG